mgnify:CR=1 FL=1
MRGRVLFPGGCFFRGNRGRRSRFHGDRGRLFRSTLSSAGTPCQGPVAVERGRSRRGLLFPARMRALGVPLGPLFLLILVFLLILIFILIGSPFSHDRPTISRNPNHCFNWVPYVSLLLPGFVPVPESLQPIQSLQPLESKQKAARLSSRTASGRVASALLTFYFIILYRVL